MKLFSLNLSGLHLRQRSFPSSESPSCSFTPDGGISSSEEEKCVYPCEKVIDLSCLEGTCCYCDAEAEKTLKRVVAAIPLNAVHFLDSGDYHYLSKIFTDRVDVPFTLVLFDNHPDMQSPAFGEMLSCGGWVRDLLKENHNLNRLIIIGSDPALDGETEGFGPVGRVIGLNSELCRDSKVWLLPGDVDPSVLHGLVEGRNVYISIDLDVLSRDFARTDWDQGTMTLSQLLTLLNAVTGRETGTGSSLNQEPRSSRAEGSGLNSILGVDICGGLSEAKGGRDEDFGINAATIRAILTVFQPIP